MKPKKFTYASIGSISSGTMRPQDLMPDFIWELRHLGHRDKRLTVIQNRVNTALNGKYGEDDAYFTDEQSSYDLFETLFDMLDAHSLPYMYFGSHPGDGSDYGFWLSENLEYDFDGLKVDDTESIPSDYVGEVIHVNDHGNMTLYYKSPRKLKEIWSVV
jgi:hypothetical protein